MGVESRNYYQAQGGSAYVYLAGLVVLHRAAFSVAQPLTDSRAWTALSSPEASVSIPCFCQLLLLLSLLVPVSQAHAVAVALD